MKKLMIAAAVAGTAVAIQAQAAPWEIVESNIVRSELALPFIEDGYLPKASGFADTLVFQASDLDITVSGDSYTINGGTISLVGDTSIVAIGAEVFLGFDIAGTPTSDGVMMNQGFINVSADTLPEPVALDMSDPENTVNMTSSGELYGVQYAGIPLGSGVVNEDGSISIAFAGVPNADENWTGLNMASAGGVLLGMPAAIFFEGSITLKEVPLPGAAWLFGSALAGLGAARRRKARAVEA